MKRRDFLKLSALGAAGTLISSTPLTAGAHEVPAASKKKSANTKIHLAFIGLGQQCMYLLSSFIQMDDVKVVAGCDVYDIKRDRFAKRVKEYYAKKGEKNVKVDMYEDYKDVLARKDVDAVVIAAPDHQHALIAIAACKAHKDIYLEKPVTLTIYEGQQLVKAVRKYNVILQVGSQQRSSEEFIHATSLCREGKLGQIEKIQVYVGRNSVNPKTGAPMPRTLPEMPVPAGLNWDKWLGPLPETVKYHSDFDPIVSAAEPQEKLWGAWRWYQVTGGGLMTDWGAHMFDIAQWALGKDRNGPVKVYPGGYRQYNTLTYLYDNGVVMTEENFDNAPGVRIFGENGTITVHRGKFTTDNPQFDMKVADNDVPYEARASHHRKFIDAVLAHVDGNVPVEVGHSSNITCCIGNIAMELNRPVTWNPIVEKFMNDPEASKKMHYEYRKGYSLDID